jgi:hypothetical protein
LEFDGPLAVPFTFVNCATSTLNIVSGTVTFAGTGAGVDIGTLSIGSGASAVIAPATISSPTVLTLGALSIEAGSLDITNNEILINYGSGPDPISSIGDWIATGSGGSTGIISSAVSVNPAYGIGYADAADNGNPAGLPAGQIKILYTLLGDANLDGAVNGIDFVILSANFNTSVTGWDEGDFNDDGKANGIDFTLLAANFNQGSEIVQATVTQDAATTVQSRAAATPESPAIVQPANVHRSVSEKIVHRKSGRHR